MKVGSIFRDTRYDGLLIVGVVISAPAEGPWEGVILTLGKHGTQFKSCDYRYCFDHDKVVELRDVVEIPKVERFPTQLDEPLEKDHLASGNRIDNFTEQVTEVLEKKHE